MRALIGVLLALFLSSCATTGGGNAKEEVAAATDAWATAFKGKWLIIEHHSSRVP